MEGITIIGTSHIARQSIREVKEAIEKGKPDIVALELDRQRLPALLRKDHRGPRMSDIGRQLLQPAPAARQQWKRRSI